eukprot:scaffold234916_cov36-Prasinocladus_malaysianus.AAC.1
MASNCESILQWADKTGGAAASLTLLQGRDSCLASADGIGWGLVCPGLKKSRHQHAPTFILNALRQPNRFHHCTSSRNESQTKALRPDACVKVVECVFQLSFLRQLNWTKLRIPQM